MASQERAPIVPRHQAFYLRANEKGAETRVTSFGSLRGIMMSLADGSCITMIPNQKIERGSAGVRKVCVAAKASRLFSRTCARRVREPDLHQPQLWIKLYLYRLRRDEFNEHRHSQHTCALFAVLLVASGLSMTTS